ncbi:GIY-YIG nuclease family protein [Geminicoccus flavidas]|uniref:GIY-YIG nuclease family protein n=1 Tax=Geminicoccus flavidas TaxID=2506407 RepID=UPI00135CB178|nr:GIY-YIG nuclease family protein [Geminicoccus flavidas]
MAAFVYIMASQRNGTLYVGVTGDLIRRVHEHRTGAVAGFTKRYGVKSLVWYEVHDEMAAAIQRETSLKRWRRDWKLALIEKINPDWQHLWDDIVQ